MSKNIFQHSAPNLILLKRLCEKAPKKMQKVTAGVLNNEAFTLRTSILKVLKKEMIIRSPGFVKKNVRVVMAKPGPVQNQVAESGSIFAARFTGWKEQQTGEYGKQKKVASKFARGGSWQGRIRPSLRRKQSNPLWRPSDFNIKNSSSEKHRLIIFLQMLKQRKIRDRFYMPRGLGQMDGGVIYKMQSSKIRGVYRKKTKKSRQIKWMDKSIDLLLKEVNILKLWEKNIRFVFRLK